MRIVLSCKECGANHFRLDEAKKDDAIIRCQECGHTVGTLADVKRDVAEQVAANFR